MIDYKEGDWVKVVRGSNGGSLPEGSEWEVYDSFKDDMFHYLALKDHPLNASGNVKGDNGWDADRFILIKTKEHVESDAKRNNKKEFVNFKRGDKVKIRQDMWEQHEVTLTRLGFSAPDSFHGYEVSQVFESQQRISLKACSNIYNSEYFELCVEESTTEMVFKPEGVHTSALDKQVSGNHYKDCGIQPIEYIHANGLNYFEGNAVKYITRHRKKNGKADIEKAIHYLELMIELEYPE